MIKRKFLAGLLTLLLLFSMTAEPVLAAELLNEVDSVPPPPEISIDAEAAFLIDADTGDVLYAMNEDEERYPASTTKIMTCYLALKYGNPDDTITLSEDIRTGMTDNSSTADLRPGEILTVYQLMQCLMIVSANEAANALAIYISGSISDFVALMNTEAAALGCTGTHFSNTNGLHDEDHYTTAHDLAIISRAAIQYPVFREICSTAETILPATNLSEERTLQNTNYLLPGTDCPAYDYSAAWGIKTGHTTPAGYCLVAAATWNGRTLLSVVLGAEKTGEDDNVEIGSFTQSAALLTWGFINYETAAEYQKYLAALPEETDEPESSNDLDVTNESPAVEDPNNSVTDPDSDSAAEIQNTEESFVEGVSLEEAASAEEASLWEPASLSLESAPPELPPSPSPDTAAADTPSVDSLSLRHYLNYVAGLLRMNASTLLLVIMTASLLLCLILLIILITIIHRRRSDRDA